MHHVVITNQHGDNRGDEAAMLAMLAGLEARLAPVRFTVIHQFADPALPVAFSRGCRARPAGAALAEGAPRLGDVDRRVGAGHPARPAARPDRAPDRRRVLGGGPGGERAGRAVLRRPLRLPRDRALVPRVAGRAVGGARVPVRAVGGPVPPPGAQPDSPAHVPPLRGPADGAGAAVGRVPPGAPRGGTGRGDRRRRAAGAASPRRPRGVVRARAAGAPGPFRGRGVGDRLPLSRRG